MGINRLRTPNELYSFGNVIQPHAVYLNGKFYVASAKQSDGKAYILVFDPSDGSVTEIQLQMPTYPDTTYGSGDVHIVPALNIIDQNTLIAVGGRHVGGTYHVEIIDLVNNTSTVYDSGVGDSTYHIVIRRSDGKFIIFMRYKDDTGYGHLYYQEFDPATGTFGSLTKVTSYTGGASAVGFGLGYDYDTNRYIIYITPDWAKRYAIEFDVETMTFYDLNGNQLTLPVDITTLTEVAGDLKTNIIKYNGYLYMIITKDVDGDGNTEMVLQKMDLSGSVVSYQVLLDDIDITNYWNDDYSGMVYYKNGKLYALYTTPSNVKYIEFDESLNITEIYSYTVPSGEAPFRPHPVFVDLSENRYELFEALATGEDDHDQTSSILEASYPLYVNVYYVAYPEIKLISYTDYVKAKVNTQFNIDVTLENTGYESGNVYVQLIDHNGNVVDEKTGIIDPNQQVTFTLTGTAPSKVYKYIWKIRYGVQQ